MTKRRDLPRCMYLSHGKYYLVKNNKWVPLSRDYSEAMAEYGRLTAHARTTGGLDQMVDEALADINVKPSTHEQYMACAERIKSAFRYGTPKATTPRHVAQFLHAHRKTPNMANRMRTVLKMCFDYGVNAGMCDSNPVQIKPFPEKSRDRYLTNEEYRAIHKHAPRHIQLMMDLAYVTGQRIGDIIGLKRSDIDGNIINFTQQKTGTRITIEAEGISELVGEALKLRKYAAFTLFHLNGKVYNYYTIRDAFRRACIKAGVEDAQLRDIRAKAATDAIEEDLDPTELLGHLDKRTTRNYIRKKRTMKSRGLKVLGIA